MSVAEAHRSLARTLPMRLQKFFAINPPRVALITSSAPVQQLETDQATEPVLPPASTNIRERLNPFLPHKDQRTGRWHPPIYSLRRQAELVKMAQKHGVEQLLPYTPKKTEERARRRVENGLRVRGTGIGQKVKGHEWERSLKSRLDVRRQAMLEMPKMIELWKQRGHGRGWTKWPK